MSTICLAMISNKLKMTEHQQKHVSTCQGAVIKCRVRALRGRSIYCCEMQPLGWFCHEANLRPPQVNGCTQRRGDQVRAQSQRCATKLDSSLENMIIDCLSLQKIQGWMLCDVVWWNQVKCNFLFRSFEMFCHFCDETGRNFLLWDGT